MHDQKLVELFGKRVIAIDDGVVVSDGMEEDDGYDEDYFVEEEEMTNAAE